MEGREAVHPCPACGTEVPDNSTVCPSCGFHDTGEPQPFEAGTVLESRYRIDTEVGRGGMGVVYRGTDLTLKRPVAIKAMRTQDADASVLARFMREARALAQVEHPGLVPVYAVGREGGTYYMVMKFVEGESLSDVLKGGARLPAEQVRRLVTEVCGALGALHRHQLIHRDIKPGNIMLGADGRVTVMDLGIVKAVGEQTQTTSTALGTPRYMPPEMLTDEDVDGRADLYSLGVIAYQALAGQAPFDGPTPMAILYKQAHEPPPPLRKLAPDVPRNLEVAIERVLAKDPAERFPDAAAFVEAVRADAVVVGGGAGRGKRAAGVAALLVIGGVVAWYLTRPPPTPPPAPDAAVAVAVKPADAAPPPVDAAPPPVDAAPPPVDAAPPPVDAAPPPEDAAPKRHRPVRTVSVRVLSDPSGALVLDGGRRLGRTPLTLRRPASGRALDLELRREGYAKARLRVPLDKDGTARAKLEPLFELVP